MLGKPGNQGPQRGGPGGVVFNRNPHQRGGRPSQFHGRDEPDAAQITPKSQTVCFQMNYYFYNTTDKDFIYFISSKTLKFGKISLKTMNSDGDDNLAAALFNVGVW